MSESLTLEQLEELEKETQPDHDMEQWRIFVGLLWEEHGPTLISMARRSLQLQERLGKAEKALQIIKDLTMISGHGSTISFGDIYSVAADFLRGSPEGLRPPVPATPPVEPDVLPLCTRCHGRGGWEGGFAGETWTECPECN
jgi:hypothetical protein